MTASSWITSVAAFVGAALSYLGARVGTRQREDQGRREEWGRRFTSALEAIKSEEPRARFLGRVLLAELARSELASAQERLLSDRLLDEDSRFGPLVSDLHTALTRRDLDDTDFIEDDENTDADEERTS